MRPSAIPWAVNGLMLLACSALATPARVVREGSNQNWRAADLIITPQSDSMAVIQYESALHDTLALRDLAVVQLYQGKRISGPHVVKSAVIGMLLSSIVTAIAISADCSGGSCDAPITLGVIAMSIGGGAGAAIGLVPVKSWHQVYASPSGKKWLHSRRFWEY